VLELVEVPEPLLLRAGLPALLVLVFILFVLLPEVPEAGEPVFELSDGVFPVP